ncbi:c-type cytochrome [Flagellimonas myxillae]|uniref:c-type cytochrome n=1 Tax=Flagellimonas myxillae TaxID=2942214 RepID=UPI00201EDCB5|nr:c-type cytochrome [Muricauda myxillae]MCL6267297.1 c-type cytochrome [Muricauda myxillae]
MGRIKGIGTNSSSKQSLDTLREMRRLCKQLGLSLLGILLICATVVVMALDAQKGVVAPDDIYFMSYDVQRLDTKAGNQQIKLGYDIFVNSPKYIGPVQSDSTKQYAGNNLACANCHLDAGTKPFAAPLIGVIKRFPQYRGREDKMGTIEERINGCMERSMNGHVMPEDSEEMRAMIAYLEWLGRYTPSNGKIGGQGFLKIEIPDRAVDLQHGKQVFQLHCVLCHGEDGQGQKQLDGSRYTYPPLWGQDSYNNGAGMTRVITAANFIKGNMPFGTTYDNPVLTDEEAYDVAGYINQKLRPTKPNREVDFPNLAKKPVSTPYGPYADPFSMEQHQKGPFQPIMEYYKKEFNLNKSK